MMVWKLGEGGIPVAVECETPGYPNRDTDGAVMYNNSHWPTEAEAWVAGHGDIDAELSYRTDEVAKLRRAVTRAERELADAAIARRRFGQAMALANDGGAE